MPGRTGGGAAAPPRPARRQKKPALRGGLNPYQRRHGGDRCNYSESICAAQHFRRENKDFPSNGASNAVRRVLGRRAYS
ncbi:hypothetical protein BURMUCF1_3553 [Burkholderia multivorans ATCC BAA-247]|nr:hypothetical protein BURMUCF1_3553 [Burkholderia multivorans ATCC BAA-247]